MGQPDDRDGKVDKSPARWNEVYTARFGKPIDGRVAEVWRQEIKRDIPDIDQSEVIAAIHQLSDERKGKGRYAPTLEQLVSCIKRMRWEARNGRQEDYAKAQREQIINFWRHEIRDAHPDRLAINELVANPEGQMRGRIPAGFNFTEAEVVEIGEWAQTELGWVPYTYQEIVDEYEAEHDGRPGRLTEAVAEMASQMKFELAPGERGRK